MTIRFEAARLSDSSAANTIDDALGDLETSIAEALGVNLDQDYTGPLNLGGQGGEMDFALIASSTQLNNFTNGTKFDKTRTLAAGALNTVGAVCRMKIFGTYSDTATNDVGNVTFEVLVGATWIFYSSRIAQHQLGVGDTNGHWEIDLELITRSTGATGVLLPMGSLETCADAKGDGRSLNGAAAPTLDLTGTLKFEVAANMGTASGNKSCKMTGWTVEILQAAHTA